MNSSSTLNRARAIIQSSVDGMSNTIDSDKLPIDPPPLSDSETENHDEDIIEYTQDYENFYLMDNNENFDPVVKDDATPSSSKAAEDSYKRDEDIPCISLTPSNSNKKRKTDHDVIPRQKAPSRFLTAKEKDSKRSSKIKIEEFAELARSKKVLSESLLKMELERHSVEMEIAQLRLKKEKFDVEVKETELEIKKIILTRLKSNESIGLEKYTE